MSNEPQAPGEANRPIYADEAWLAMRNAPAPRRVQEQMDIRTQRADVDNGRECEFLFRTVEEQQRVVYVSSGPGGYDDAARLFVGVPPDLSAVPVTEVLRSRDGGTTDVVTAQGGLIAPAPLSRETPCWVVRTDGDALQETELVPLDPDRYVITETEQQATIHPR